MKIFYWEYRLIFLFSILWIATRVDFWLEIWIPMGYRLPIIFPYNAVENLTVVKKDFYEFSKNKRKMQTLLIFVQVISALECAREWIEMSVSFWKLLLIDSGRIIIKSPE